MNLKDEIKVCPLCAESIKIAAKVCPHCRHWQKKWSMENPLVRGTLVTLPLVLVWVGGVFFVARLFDRGRDFAEYRDQIVAIASTMSFNPTEKVPTISTVGTLKNNSTYSWKEVQIEVQYFDKDGKLIDTKSGRDFDDALLPNGERAFRLRTPADKPAANYASHKVFVRYAKDARAWP